VLGSLILNRLFFTKALPTPLVPTLAIELVPRAVAGLAWFVINGGTIDVVARVLGRGPGGTGKDRIKALIRSSCGTSGTLTWRSRIPNIILGRLMIRGTRGQETVR
jgi:tellurite resistance protein TehA-like permease